MGMVFSPVLSFSLLLKKGLLYLCKLFLLAPASWNCSLAVQWQQIICVMDLLFGMCENSAFRLIDTTELTRHQCYSKDTSKVDSEHGYKSRSELFKRKFWYQRLCPLIALVIGGRYLSACSCCRLIVDSMENQHKESGCQAFSLEAVILK